MQLFFYSLGIFLTFVFTSNPLKISFIFKLIPLIYTFFFIFFYFKATLFKPVKIGLLLLIFAQLIGILRSKNPNSTVFTNLYIFLSQIFFCIFIFVNNTQMIKKRVGIVKLLFFSFILPLSLFCFLNYFLLINNLSTNNLLEIGDAVLLQQLFGISVQRVNFPLVAGAVNFAFIIGVNILSMVLIWRHLSNNVRLVVGLNLFFHLYLLLLNDSRFTIFILMFVILIYLFGSGSLKNFFYKSVPFLSFLGPLIFVFSTIVIVNFGIDEYLSRGKNDFVTGNSRFIIWLAVFDDLKSFEYWQIFGLGNFGTYYNGTSEFWASFFQSFDEPLLTTSHNVVFNLFYDLGYVGVFLYIKNIFDVFYFRCSNNNFIVPKLLLAFFVIQGIADVPFGFYTFQNNAIFYLMFTVFYYVIYEDSNLFKKINK